MRLTSVFRRHFVMLVDGLPLVANTQQQNGRESAAPRSEVPPRVGLVLHFACSSHTQTVLKRNSPKPQEINTHTRKLRSALNVSA